MPNLSFNLTIVEGKKKKERKTNNTARRALLTGLRFVAGGKYDPVLKDNAYKIHMKLTINSVSPADYGSYKCVSRNSLGDTDGSIKVYRKYNHGVSALKIVLPNSSGATFANDSRNTSPVVELNKTAGFHRMNSSETALFAVIQDTSRAGFDKSSSSRTGCSLLSSSCVKIVGIFLPR